MLKNSRLALVIIGPLLVATAACSEQSGGSADSHSQPVLMRVDDPLGSASLSDLVNESDVVLSGTVVDKGTPVEISRMDYTPVTVQTSDAIKGNAADKVVVLMALTDDKGRELAMEGRPSLTDDESVWLLRRVDSTFDAHGDYVLTSVAGVIPGTDDKITASDTSAPAIKEALTHQSIGDLVTALRSMAR